MRHKAIFLLSALCLSTTAQEATSETKSDATLGRLFTTPTERAILDQARINGHMPAVVEKSEDGTIDQATFNGYVTRKSGKNTTWINQVEHTEKDRSEILQISQLPNQPPVIYLQTETGQRIKVPVGDTVDMHNGVVRKVFENSH